MGLAVTAYCDVRKADGWKYFGQDDYYEDPYGNRVEYGSLEFRELCNAYVHHHYSEQADGIECSMAKNVAYEHGGAYREVHYPYSTHSAFRHWLSGLPGAEEAFKPFLNFSDCEGTIGPYTSARLADAFEQYVGVVESLLSSEDEQIRADAGWWKPAFTKWHATFRYAAGTGFVKFC